MSSFKVGDMVRVVRRAVEDAGWVPSMEQSLAERQVLQVEAVCGKSTKLANGWWYHSNDLEPVGIHVTNNNQENDSMSIQNDIINQNLTDNQEYLRRKGVVGTDGSVSSSSDLLQVLLAMNEDAVVSYMKAAEAKAKARLKGTVDQETPTVG